VLGKLTWAAIPFDQPIPLITGAAVLVIILAVVAWVVIAGHLPYLWREWITSVDHKRIGVMYTLLAMVRLLRGFADAIMMRSQQAIAYHSQGHLQSDFFGARHHHAVRDWAHERCRAAAVRRSRRGVSNPELSRALAERNRSSVGQHIACGRRVRADRLAALSSAIGVDYSPGVGVDYYLWSLQISGVGTLLTDINWSRRC
jgi:cytochrome o ubiquinol oxidase subunit 1